MPGLPLLLFLSYSGKPTGKVKLALPPGLGLIYFDYVICLHFFRPFALELELICDFLIVIV